MTKYDAETKVDSVAKKTAAQIHEDRVAKLVLCMIWTGAEHKAVADALNTAGLSTADSGMWNSTDVQHFIQGMSK